MLARGRTGSGKTAAFAIPVLQKILDSKTTADEQATTALILAPSRELARQIYTVLGQLTSSCGRVVNCVDVSAQVDLAAQKAVLADRPDVVVGTPARVLAHEKAGNLKLTSLEMVVIDEADLIFSFGYNTFNFHAYYSLQDLFDDGTQTVDGDRLGMVPLHVGIIFYIL